jgi:hypothetical protein
MMLSCMLRTGCITGAIWLFSAYDSLTVDTSGKRFPVKNFAPLLVPIYHRCPISTPLVPVYNRCLITTLNHQSKTRW